MFYISFWTPSDKKMYLKKTYSEKTFCSDLKNGA